MQISFGSARALDDGVWTGTLSPAEARRLPGAPLRSAGPHARAGAIKLVVRTRQVNLMRAGLPHEPERPPSYWAMKIHGDADVETALRFVEVARPANSAA